MTFGERVKARRLQLGATLEEIGNKVGVTNATVSRWETGEILSVRTDKLIPLAKALDTSSSYLLGLTDNPDDESASDSVGGEAHAKTMAIGDAPLSGTERGLLAAEYIKQIIIGVELLIVDPANLAFLEDGAEDTDKRISMGYAFPMSSYAKVDKLKAENDMLKAVIALCHARQEFKATLEGISVSTHDDTVLAALGIL